MSSSGETTTMLTDTKKAVEPPLTLTIPRHRLSPQKSKDLSSDVDGMTTASSKSADSEEEEVTFPSFPTLRRKRSNTFCTSPRGQNLDNKFKSPMAALSFFASMEDDEVIAAKLLTEMFSQGQGGIVTDGNQPNQPKLPSFLNDRLTAFKAAKQNKRQRVDGGSGDFNEASSTGSIKMSNPATNKNVVVSNYGTRARSNSNVSWNGSTALGGGGSARGRSNSNVSWSDTNQSIDIHGRTTTIKHTMSKGNDILPLPPMPNPAQSGYHTSRTPPMGGIAAKGIIPDFANFATGGMKVAGNDLNGARTQLSPPIVTNGVQISPITHPTYGNGNNGEQTSDSTASAVEALVRGQRAATLPDAPFLAVNRMDTIGIYTPEERKRRIERFWEKRRSRVWTKKVKYDVRKNFADSRIRVKGRFVKKEDEISILSSSVSQFAQSSSAIKTLNGN